MARFDLAKLYPRASFIMFFSDNETTLMRSIGRCWISPVFSNATTSSAESTGTGAVGAHKNGRSSAYRWGCPNPAGTPEKINVFQLLVIIYHCERSAQMPAVWGSSKWKCENKERIVMFDICGPHFYNWSKQLLKLLSLALWSN